MSLADAMGGHTVATKLLVTYGTPEQKDAYLSKMATGEIRAAMALTEPGSGPTGDMYHGPARRRRVCRQRR
jgi:alkylation response protein AidB-like acyl-CoA dehydrogenase